MDYVTYADVYGNVSNIAATNVDTTSSDNEIKLYTGNGVNITGAIFRNISGVGTNGGVALQDNGVASAGIFSGILIDGLSTVSKYPAMLQSTHGNDITIRNVLLPSVTSTQFLYISGTYQNVHVQGIKSSSGAVLTNDDVIKVTGSVSDLTMSQISLAPPDSGALVEIGGTVGDFTLSDSDINAAGTSSYNVILGDATANIARMAVSNFKLNESRCLFDFLAGAIIPKVEMVNSFIYAPGRLANLYTSVDLSLSNVTIDSPVAAPIYASGSGVNIILRGSGINRATAWTGVQLANSATFKPMNRDFNNPAPTFAQSGSGTPTLQANSDDLHGTLTLTTGGTGGIITFSQPRTNAPACMVSGVGAITSQSASTTALTWTASAIGAYSYHCDSIGE